jgi:hypothetical protein
MNLSNTFLRVAVVFSLIGVGMGYVMGATQNFAGAPVHAHINLLGWVSMFLYGLFYRATPEAAIGWLPKVHLGLAVSGFLIFMPSLAVEILMHGSPLMALAGPGLIVGPTLVLLGFTLFAVIVFLGTRPSPAPVA